MKKNNTGSKVSLRRLPVDEPPTRIQRKQIETNAVRTNTNASAAVVKCNNCDTMVERELMKLHLNMCHQVHRDARGFVDVEVCKICRTSVPLHRIEEHRCLRNQPIEEVERPNFEFNADYMNSCEGNIDHPSDRKNQPRKEPQGPRQDQQQEMKRAPKRPTATGNNRIKRSQQRQAIIQTRNRPESRQKELNKRARTNQIQHRPPQREVVDRTRPREPPRRQEQRPLIQSQQQRERQQRQNLRVERDQREVEREREQQHQQQQQQRRRQVPQARNNLQEPVYQQANVTPQPARRNEQNPQQNNRRQRRRVAQSSNSRHQQHRQRQNFGLNFLPFDILNRIQTRFNHIQFNASSFSQHMENLSQQLGSVMENFSHMMMSPFGNHNRRRVIWYEEDIGSGDDEGSHYYEEEYYEVGMDDDSYYEEDPQEEQGLDINEIDEIPVHQYNARRQHPHSDTTSKSCAVCLSDFIHGQTIKLLYCSHKFHQQCIDRWLEMKGNCPVCREDLRSG